MAAELAKRNGRAFELIDRDKFEAVCQSHRNAISTATRVETIEKKADELETLLAAIRKWKPEFTPQVNSLWLFARKRIGELTPKERGKRNDFSDQSEKLSQADQDRRWENAALAEFWEHEALNERLESGTISLKRAMEFVKLERARKKAARRKGETPRNTVLHAPFQSVMAGIPDESVDLIFADPPWDSASIGLYGDIGRGAGRILVPGGSMLVYSSSQMLNRTIGLLASDGMKFQGLCYDVRNSGSYARLNRDGIIIRVMPLIWYVKGACRFGSADFVEDALVTSDKQKESHDWQQHESVAAYYLAKLCPEGGVVFDPFCGGGTTAAMAVALGCEFITCDIDEIAVASARSRLNA